MVAVSSLPWAPTLGLVSHGGPRPPAAREESVLATPSAAALSLWFPGFLVPQGEERFVGAQGAGLQGGLGRGCSGCRWEVVVTGPPRRWVGERLRS